MVQHLQAIRGMNDILPEETPYWGLLETVCKAIVQSYGYQEIRFPLLEQTALFQRTIGEATDIVEKEMYTFADRNGDSLTLRPEGTAGCVRAGIEHGLFYKQVQRLWYLGPMFRHERPQKGRYRQFHQLGVEACGMANPEVDAELIFMCRRLWEALGVSEFVELQLNTLGTLETRVNYRKKLVAYFEKHVNELDADSQRRLVSNPLRILDSKNPDLKPLIAAAPKLLDYLDPESHAHFDRLKVLLDHAHIPYVINPTLVRGLDYYGRTVFEWVTDQLGAQGTVCAGGRYDTLIEQLGGQPTPAAGFAAGLERLVLLLRTAQKLAETPRVYVVLMGDAVWEEGLRVAERLRDALPAFTVETDLSGGSIKAQFKRADKKAARWAVVIGDEEIKTGRVSVKDLRQDLPQQRLGVEELITYFKEKSEL